MQTTNMHACQEKLSHFKLFVLATRIFSARSPCKTFVKTCKFKLVFGFQTQYTDTTATVDLNCLRQAEHWILSVINNTTKKTEWQPSPVPTKQVLTDIFRTSLSYKIEVLKLFLKHSVGVEQQNSNKSKDPARLLQSLHEKQRISVLFPTLCTRTPSILRENKSSM